ncbi:MAG TPA: hypothetical protein VNI02_06885 [Blastocatellia bacterium]|jgi:plastocyanin|nr:hypothetical protein [Blastocatellia bacterium]
MNIFDSRFISPGDFFVQTFSVPGRYRYGFGPLGVNRGNPANSPFIINVKETSDSEREGRQHNVIVEQDCGTLKADPPELDIEANDAVLWSPCDHNTPGFSVSGYSETDSFDSTAMTRQALYVHTFGSAGVYDWEDSHGQGVSGSVEVTMPPVNTPREIESYRESLTKAIMVEISGGKVEPKKARALVGQAVCFVVEKADGISITDCKMTGKIPAPHSPDSPGKC